MHDTNMTLYKENKIYQENKIPSVYSFFRSIHPSVHSSIQYFIMQVENHPSMHPFMPVYTPRKKDDPSHPIRSSSKPFKFRLWSYAPIKKKKSIAPVSARHIIAR
ncbi:hypothetical protein EYC84_006729 [Monilinia fructicola]|uniref:Uncharacterized protein n=1 Tax=Monilinia fructicola TaxID=38448 RepID=A0A5M9K6U1_MONFR|nr:hypothetical protein EYC84_006729 [Monilinia fructicola]